MPPRRESWTMALHDPADAASTAPAERRVVARPPPRRQQLQLAPRIRAPRIRAPRIRAPRIGAPRIGAPRIGAPRIGAPRIGAPRIRPSTSIYSLSDRPPSVLSTRQSPLPHVPRFGPVRQTGATGQLAVQSRRPRPTSVPTSACPSVGVRGQSVGFVADAAWNPSPFAPASTRRNERHPDRAPPAGQHRDNPSIGAPPPAVAQIHRCPTSQPPWPLPVSSTFSSGLAVEYPAIRIH